MGDIMDAFEEAKKLLDSIPKPEVQQIVVVSARMDYLFDKSSALLCKNVDTNFGTLIVSMKAFFEHIYPTLEKGPTSDIIPFVEFSIYFSDDMAVDVIKDAIVSNLASKQVASWSFVPAEKE